MHDDGLNGDALAGDDIFSVTLPASVQTHRRLVRYRITAEDGVGHSLQVPYADDPQPNFAYFCYDGIPAWSAADEPGTTPVQNFSSVLMQEMPAYHLIADALDVERCQYQSAYRGTRFRGTLVYDGNVYDHIEFNVRGEGSTYRTGKNKWRFHFNRGHDFEARDNFGKKYDGAWRDMKANGGTAPWTYVNRGMAGIDECITYRFFELAGVPSSRTHYFQLRVIDAASENGSSQYTSDLWGLYHAIEVPKGDFLDDRNLPDGNVYKLESPVNQDHQGADSVVGPADYNAIRPQMNTGQSQQWWRDRFDHRNYARYKAVAEAVSHYDQRDGLQGYYYHNPVTDLWTMMPWDCDTMFQTTAKYYTWDRFRHCLSPGYSTNFLEGQNEQREVLDLLFNEKGVDTAMAEFIDLVNPAGEPLTWADVDQFQWNYHPKTPSQFKGSYNVLTGSSNPANHWYTRTLISADHEGQMDYMKKFMRPGGHGYDNLVAEVADANIPNTPTLSYSGSVGFPTDQLEFTSSNFSDPNGVGTFAGMEWRVAEISDETAPNYVPDSRQPYEIDAVWESGVQGAFSITQDIPAGVLNPGSVYRARVRHLDNSGRWSHWSAPVEFLAGSPSLAPYQNGLVISEIMYHPSGDGDLEFIELMNVGTSTLSLIPLRFTDGIEYDFSTGTITSLAPGERVLLVKNTVVFEAEYGVGLPITGEYQFSSSNSLSNGGETIVLSYGEDIPIRTVTYDDEGLWPLAADGGGSSLVLIHPESVPDHNLPENWRASVSIGGGSGGNPGGTDAVPYTGGDLVDYLLDDPVCYDIATRKLVADVKPGADDVKMTPQWSSDLNTWNESDFTFLGNEQSAWQFTGAAGSKMFFRLKLELR